MSGQSDIKSTTCPKCRNKNPPEAAFCGFCGGDLRAKSVPEKATMFGYIADLKLPGAGSAEAQPAPSPAPIPAPVSPDKTVPADEAPTTAFAAGEGYVAGRYWLASGSQKTQIGELFVDRDSKSEGNVALTLIDDSTFPSPLDMERTRRELRQLQKVNNKHLVRVLDHGKHDDGRLYVTTEIVDGSTLDALVQRGPLDLASAKRLLRGIGAGLSAAQTVGIVHRDIAPHNVIVTDEGEPKVRAIGAAPRLKDHLHGTAEYLSPEQASGRPVDQRSNIYSLGALMYYMMTGRPPFGGDTEQVLEQHKNAEPPPLTDAGAPVPAAERVQALLNKAMSKNSSRRHLTLRQFLREIEALSTDLTPAPSPAVQAQTAPAAGSDALAATMISGAALPLAESRAAPAAPPPTTRPPAQQVVVTDPQLAQIDDSAATLQGAETEPPLTDTSPAAFAPTPLEMAPAAQAEPGQLQPEQPQSAPDVSAAPIPLTESVGGPEAPPAAEPSPVPEAAAEVPAQDPAQTRPPVSAAAASAVVGEMSGGERVRMRQTSEQQRVDSDDPAAPVASPGGGAAPAAPPAGPAGKGFRETMWFFKGEVESAMAEKGEPVPPTEEEVAQEDLSDKYADDGSIDDDAARRLSLRTGKTQMMMQAAKVPSGNVPGDKMKAEEFIGEINQGRKLGVIVVALIAVAVVGMTIWLLVS